jgi:GNAT superfamily N-acetyltransferase
LDDALLSRVEDAGLNASAPPQQRWLDGWLVRRSPGKARRARCVNALAAGRLPLAEKLRLCETLYREAGLPLLVRVTRFTQPAGLDAQLAALGFEPVDDVRVMVCPTLPTEEPTALPPLSAGTHWATLDASAYAEAVGALRGSSPEQRLAHAQRLALSPVPYHGYAIRRDDDETVLACGQFAIESGFVGLYDVFTREGERGRGLAGWLCRRLLSQAATQGARMGYLQVEGDNHAARHVYQRLGFVDGYRYHYRQLLPE